MGDHDDGEAGVMKLSHEAEELPARRGVEPGAGFVEHEDLGFDRQHAGERDAAFLPAR